jgi:hypothetical protein
MRRATMQVVELINQKNSQQGDATVGNLQRGGSTKGRRFPAPGSCCSKDPLLCFIAAGSGMREGAGDDQLIPAILRDIVA